MVFTKATLGKESFGTAEKGILAQTVIALKTIDMLGVEPKLILKEVAGMFH